MRVKLALPLPFLLVPATLALAADVFVEHGLDRARWSEAFVSALLSHGGYDVPEVPAALKALAPAQRVAVVDALARAARAYAATPEFRGLYKAHYDRSLPEALRTPRTAEQIARELRTEAARQMAEAQAFLKELPPEQRQAVEKQLGVMREQMTQIDELARTQAEQERLAHEDAKRLPPDPAVMPADPNVALKSALNDFLAGTAGVDYAAVTRETRGIRVFANASYESKPSPWKMCFRAGREACEAARGAARTWLRELR
jgi:hypothetical protein